MSGIEVEVRVWPTELNGTERKGLPSEHEPIVIGNHRVSKGRIVLKLPDGTKYTFLANELQEAIKRASS